MKNKGNISRVSKSGLKLDSVRGKPLIGREMQNPEAIANGSVAVHEGKVLETGTSDFLLKKRDGTWP